MIVIPMAGASSRFALAGYKNPKYMLDLHGRPVFDYALSSFRAQFGSEKFLIVCRDLHGTPEFVKRRCSILGINDVEIVILTEPTTGQGETVFLGLERMRVDGFEPVTIFNIDSFRLDFQFPIESVKGISFLEVFRGKGDHWSFVEPKRADANKASGSVHRVLEKNRISDLCCTGLYHFRIANDFRYAYDAETKNPSQDLSETYIAPMYNQLVARGDEVRFRVIDDREIFFCGVPAEFDDCLRTDTLSEQFFGQGE